MCSKQKNDFWDHVNAASKSKVGEPELCGDQLTKETMIFLRWMTTNAISQMRGMNVAVVGTAKNCLHLNAM